MKLSIHSEIINVLKFRTKKGEITWSENISSPMLVTDVSGTYENQPQIFKIGIFRIEEDSMYMPLLPGSVCAELSFIDSENNVFDKVSVFSTSSSDYKSLSELYDLAKQSVSGAIKKLEFILTTLKNNPPSAQP